MIDLLFIQSTTTKVSTPFDSMLYSWAIRMWCLCTMALPILNWTLGDERLFNCTSSYENTFLAPIEMTRDKTSEEYFEDAVYTKKFNCNVDSVFKFASFVWRGHGKSNFRHRQPRPSSMASLRVVHVRCTQIYVCESCCGGASYPFVSIHLRHDDKRIRITFFLRVHDTRLWIAFGWCDVHQFWNVEKLIVAMTNI